MLPNSASAPAAAAAAAGSAQHHPHLIRLDALQPTQSPVAHWNGNPGLQPSAPQLYHATTTSFPVQPPSQTPPPLHHQSPSIHMPTLPAGAQIAMVPPGFPGHPSAATFSPFLTLSPHPTHGLPVHAMPHHQGAAAWMLPAMSPVHGNGLFPAAGYHPVPFPHNMMLPFPSQMPSSLPGAANVYTAANAGAGVGAGASSSHGTAAPSSVSTGMSLPPTPQAGPALSSAASAAEPATRPQLVMYPQPFSGAMVPGAFAAPPTAAMRYTSAAAAASAIGPANTVMLPLQLAGPLAVAGGSNSAPPGAMLFYSAVAPGPPGGYVSFPMPLSRGLPTGMQPILPLEALSSALAARGTAASAPAPLLIPATAAAAAAAAPSTVFGSMYPMSTATDNTRMATAAGISAPASAATIVDTPSAATVSPRSVSAPGSAGLMEEFDACGAEEEEEENIDDDDGEQDDAISAASSPSPPMPAPLSTQDGLSPHAASFPDGFVTGASARGLPAREALPPTSAAAASGTHLSPTSYNHRPRLRKAGLLLHGHQHGSGQSSHDGLGPRLAKLLVICDQCHKRYSCPKRFVWFRKVIKSIDVAVERCGYCSGRLDMRDDRSASAHADSAAESRTLMGLDEFDGRTHPCRLCPAVFKRADRLLAHSRVHNGVKAFSCDRCHKSFSRKDRLKKHVLDNHPYFISAPSALPASGRSHAAPDSVAGPSHVDPLASVKTTVASPPKGCAGTPARVSGLDSSDSTGLPAGPASEAGSHG